MSQKKIITIITSILNYRVIVTKDSLDHALKHFVLPDDIFSHQCMSLAQK